MNEPFWKITATEGKPTTEGLKLYAPEAGAMRIVLWQKGVWLADPDEFGYHSLVDPFCWANVEDLPPLPVS